MRKATILFVISFIICGSLAACGQKGPLYLPGPDIPQEKSQEKPQKK